MSPADFLFWAVDISFAIVMVAIALGFYRIAKGPSLADRVVSLDMMTISIMAFCGLYAIFAQSTAFLDVAIVVALIGFLATVALARYAEREEAQRQAKANREETDT
jgi:multisubunit Na+/H+ antiporter MnhF subunit